MNSKNIISIAVLCMTIFASCKKDKDEATPTPSSPEPLEHPLLEIGNKWVYETVYVDEKGKETFVGLDSTYIEKDTIINGKKWYKSIFGGQDVMRRLPYIVLYRDSAGILINNFGERTLEKYKNKGMVSTRFIYGLGKVQQESHSFLKPNDTTVTVPAGTFKVKNIETMVKIYDGHGRFGVTYNYNWYSENIGVSIYSTYSYAWPILFGIDEHYEKRLVRYVVQ